MARIVKKPTERRSDIVNAARCLLLTKAYDKTTMQDVMDYLGIAKGTIYHYFESKEALLEAVIASIVDTHIEQMQALINEATGNALVKIKILVEASNMAKDNNVIFDHLHRPGSHAIHISLLAATLVKLAPLYEKLIQQGCEEGLFQTDTPLECAEFILSAIQFLTDVGIYHWTQKDLSRRAHAFPKLIEQHLRAPPGSFYFMATHIKPAAKSDLQHTLVER